jgi:hypothetical protein
MGRPAHKPDPASRRQVEALAGYGAPEIDIAGVVGIDPKSLRKHYREELDNGHVKANAKVAENLYRKATGDGREAVIAAIFWLKTRAGWKETVVNEHTIGRSADMLSDDELTAIAIGYRRSPVARLPFGAERHRPHLLREES